MLMVILVLGTFISTIGQTPIDRSQYVKFMNMQAQKNGGSSVKFTNDMDGNVPQIIITFDLSKSPDGKIVIGDIPYFVKGADWQTFETMFELGFIWICFDQVNICYNKNEIIDMIWND